jgi:hypothetical protein
VAAWSGEKGVGVFMSMWAWVVWWGRARAAARRAFRMRSGNVILGDFLGVGWLVCCSLGYVVFLGVVLVGLVYCWGMMGGNRVVEGDEWEFK